jgi:hypothetical protein
MEGPDEGFKEAVAGVVIGIVIQALLSAFTQISLFSPYVWYFQLIQLIGIISDFLMIIFITKVGVGFFVGWFTGMLLMAYVGYVEIWLIIAYILATAVSLGIRAWYNTSHYD